MDKRKNITRIEVIEAGLRKYTKWDCEVEESIQDGGKTLKLFVKEPKRHRNDILRDIRYEESPGIHTFTMCKCGRQGCRSGKCLKCLREELNS